MFWVGLGMFCVLIKKMSWGGILGKLRPHLGKLRPIWAICSNFVRKVGKSALELGGKNSIINGQKGVLRSIGEFKLCLSHP